MSPKQVFDIRICLHLALIFVGITCKGQLQSFTKAQGYPPYTCLTNHLVIEAYENGSDSTISWDENGVILSNGYHHPVLSAIYGILCYDAFKSTQDSSFYQKFLNQAAFFIDSENHTSAFKGKGIGLAYDFDYHDLKAPMYSGMAQGMALSMLLRYRELTGDKKVDRICHRLAYFMLQPVGLGGTVGRLESGEPWIEEYPGSLESPHVLNGSINAWIGLDEYCKAFPKEKKAAQLRDSLLLSFEKKVGDFTVDWWCKYDMGHRFCTPSYLRYHVFQMQQLYEITGREIFRLQKVIWAVMLTGTEIEPEEKFSRKDYTMAVSAVYQPNGWCVPEYGLDPETGAEAAQGSTLNFNSLADLKKFLIDGKFSDSPAKENATEKVVLMQFDRPIHANMITLNHSVESEDMKINLFAITRDNQLVRLELKQGVAEFKFWQAMIQGKVPAMGYNRLVVAFSGSKAGRVGKMTTGLFDTRDFLAPEYGYYRTSPIPMERGERYRIFVPTQEIDEVLVFYRHARIAPELKEATFTVSKMVSKGQITASEDGVFQFLVVYKVKNLRSLAGMLRYEKMD